VRVITRSNRNPRMARTVRSDRIEQIESRFQELGKDYRLKIYPDANHGFFCNERSSYHQAAAADSWHELIGFFQKQLLYAGNNP
jgi:carboxymethylenebutenolidase